jgi:hypothetical protein
MNVGSSLLQGFTVFSGVPHQSRVRLAEIRFFIRYTGEGAEGHNKLHHMMMFPRQLSQGIPTRRMLRADNTAAELGSNSMA